MGRKAGKISLIIKNLYVGNEFVSKEEEFLNKKNIKAVVCLGCQPSNFENIKYHVINIKDEDGVNIIDHLSDATEFINTNIKNGSVLVHCKAGICRSASVAIAYLIRYHNMKFIDAYHLVLEKRSIIKPRDTFVWQLNQFHDILEQAKENQITEVQA